MPRQRHGLFVADQGAGAIQKLDDFRVQEIATYSNKRLEAMGQKPLPPIKRIGHGIGLEATTPPSVNMLDETVLVPGMTIAIEPRVVFDIGGLLLEESVLVTETGHELLTTGLEKLGVIR